MRITVTARLGTPVAGADTCAHLCLLLPFLAAGVDVRSVDNTVVREKQINSLQKVYHTFYMYSHQSNENRLLLLSR